MTQLSTYLEKSTCEVCLHKSNTLLSWSFFVFKHWQMLILALMRYYYLIYQQTIYGTAPNCGELWCKAHVKGCTYFT